jgi:hypothetical protein
VIDYARTYATLAPIIAQQVQRAGAHLLCRRSICQWVCARCSRITARYDLIALTTRACVAWPCSATGRHSTADDAPPVGDWALVYEVTRRARFDEAFRIWARRD